VTDNNPTAATTPERFYPRMTFEPMATWETYGPDDTVERNDQELRFRHPRETDLVIVRPYQPMFDAEHWKSIHRHLYQDSDPHAGEFRTSNHQPESRYIDHTDLETGAGRVFDRVMHDRRFIMLDRTEFAEAASVLMVDMTRLRPFDDGNDRTQRLFLDQLADHCGWRIDWPNIEKPALQTAVLQAHLTEYVAPICNLFNNATKPSAARSDYPTPLAGALAPVATATPAVARAPAVEPGARLTR
jgi:fido (protein-threonine AMPylation protein)